MLQRKQPQEVLPVVHGKIEGSMASLEFCSNYATDKNYEKGLEEAKRMHDENSHSSVVYIGMEGKLGDNNCYMGLTIEKTEELIEGLTSMVKYIKGEQ